MLRWIAKWPMRKPLVLVVVIMSVAVILHSVYQDKDIPSNTAGFMSVFVGAVVGSYFASSAFESVHTSSSENCDPVVSEATRAVLTEERAYDKSNSETINED
ncbi:MAG: hypothetical protein LBD57_04540 [Endomicrobium sp.]|nr:hypothetical protein [Endomicrobium sp.]